MTRIQCVFSLVFLSIMHPMLSMDAKASTKLTDADRLILMAHDDLRRDIITLESWIDQLECVAVPEPCVLCKHTQACSKKWAPRTVQAQRKAVRSAILSVIGQTRRLGPLTLSNGKGFEACAQRSRRNIHELLWDGWSVLRRLSRKV